MTDPRPHRRRRASRRAAAVRVATAAVATTTLARSALATGLVAATLAALPGCVTSEQSSGPARPVGGGFTGLAGGSGGAPGTPVRAGGEDVTAILDQPLGTAAPVYSSDVMVRVESLGSVPWDELQLPLVHPAGDLVAVQVGLAPDWDTLVAAPGQMPPVTSRIEVWALAEDEGGDARLVTSIDEPAVLGRAVSEEGFLIESPRADGARWIGLASWTTGEVRWIVREPGRVAAFATLGPGGQIAWSSRPIATAPASGDDASRAEDAPDFDLVVGVLPPTGLATETARLPGRGVSWLMPAYSGIGAGLFASMLDARGALDVVHLDASGPGTMRRSLKRIRLARDGATVRTTWQMMALHQGLVGGPDPIEPAVEILHFAHPSRVRRAAWWTPDRPLPEILEAGTVGLLPDRTNPNYGLIVFDDGQRRSLRRGNLFSEIDRLEVMEGLHVPRPCAGTNRHYVVFTPIGRELLCTVAEFLPVRYDQAPRTQTR